MGTKVKTTASLGVSFHQDDSKWIGSVPPDTKGTLVGPLDNPRLEGYGYMVIEVSPSDVTNIPEGWEDDVRQAERCVVVCREEQYEVVE